LQTLRNTVDAREQGLEQFTIGASACTPATQQIDLHEVHGIDIGVSECQRALLGAFAVQKFVLLFDEQQ